MATRTQILLEDDIDGGSADQTVSFTANGAGYEIDLSDKNVQRFQEALEPFVTKARRVGGRNAGRTTRQKARAGGSSNTDELQAIRAWANGNGYKVSERGRVSVSVVEAYKLAH